MKTCGDFFEKPFVDRHEKPDTNVSKSKKPASKIQSEDISEIEQKADELAVDTMNMVPNGTNIGWK